MALARGLTRELVAGCAKPEADAIAAFDVTVVGFFGQADGDEYAQAANPALIDGRVDVGAVPGGEGIEIGRAHV